MHTCERLGNQEIFEIFFISASTGKKDDNADELGFSIKAHSLFKKKTFILSQSKHVPDLENGFVISRFCMLYVFFNHPIY